MPIYKDIKLMDDDIFKDSDQQVATLTDREVIAQDLIHMIRESGLVVRMIGERSPDERRLLSIEVVLLVETDRRIVPGTVVFNTDELTRKRGRWTLRADTYEFGPITTTITIGESDE